MGGYLAAVELMFFFNSFFFFFFFGHKLDYVTLSSTGHIKCPSLHTSSMNPSPSPHPHHCREAHC